MYLRTKFHVFSIILTGFRQRVILLPPPQEEPIKSPPRLGLKLYQHHFGKAIKVLMWFACCNDLSIIWFKIFLVYLGKFRFISIFLQINKSLLDYSDYSESLSTGALPRKNFEMGIFNFMWMIFFTNNLKLVFKFCQSFLQQIIFSPTNDEFF